MTRADLLAGTLDEFIEVSPEVEAAAIVSADGLPIASALPDRVEEERLAAMSAALLILGDRAASGMGKGELSQIMVETGEGYVILMSAGPQAVLIAVTSGQAKAGLTLFEMRRMAASVADILSGAPEPGANLEDAAARDRQVLESERFARGGGEQPSVPTWR
jgi:uncharacterized protein